MQPLSSNHRSVLLNCTSLPHLQHHALPAEQYFKGKVQLSCWFDVGLGQTENPVAVTH